VNEYKRRHRVAPLWLAILLTIPIGGGAYGVFCSSRVDRIAGGPMFCVFGYLLLALYVNTARVHVNWEGIRAGHGPLPLAPGLKPVSHTEVARVYVRHAWMVTKGGGYPYLAAGVEKRDGTWMDLSKVEISDAEVWAEAREIALALCRPDPVVEIFERNPPKLDWKAAMPIFLWGGAVVACFIWGAFAEITFHR